MMGFDLVWRWKWKWRMTEKMMLEETGIHNSRTAIYQQKRAEEIGN
jgi:hypothetical protein